MTNISTIAKSVRMVLIFLCACCFQASANADNAAGYICISFRDGSTIELPASSKASFSFQNGKIVVKQDNKEVIQTPAEGIHKIVLTEKTTVMVPDIEEPASLRLGNGVIFLSGFKPRESVTIHDVRGSRLYYDEIPEEGTCSVATDFLPAGTYIMKAGNRTLKFFKR